MKRAVLIFLALAAACPLHAEPKTPPRHVRVEPRMAHGVWEGWGVSLCWWAKVFGHRADIADVLFTVKDTKVEKWSLPGLGFNIARYNAGACSWNEIDGRRMVVSKIILPYRQMEGFWLDGKNPDAKSWDWKADANQRAMLLMAKDRGANRFELFSNSPMWWMCANGNPSGAGSKTRDNLPPENYQQFAVYLAEVAARAKDHWGVAFTTIEPFNEPVSGWWFDNCKQEGCYFSPHSQAAFLPRLRAELDERGLRDLPIAASDETSYSDVLKTWNSFDAKTRSLVGQFNVHGYQGVKGPRHALHETVTGKDRKPLWNSEYGDKFADGIEMARCLHLDFHGLRPLAWCYWQALDGGGWGMFDADMPKGVIKAVNPKFFVLAQYTRHIRPGMTLLETDDANTVAAYSPTERKLALVVFNDGAARRLAFDLTAFRLPDGPVTCLLTEPKGATRYTRQPDLRLSAGRFEADLPADSIQTFEMEGAATFP